VVSGIPDMRSRFLVSWMRSSRSLDLAALASALSFRLIDVVVELADGIQILLVGVHPVIELLLVAVAVLVDAASASLVL